MKKGNILVILILSFAFSSFPRLSLSQEDSVKAQIMAVLRSDDPRDWPKGDNLFLQLPDVLEEIVFSKEKTWSGFRNNSFVALSLCCFRGAISTEKFMEIAIHLIRDIKSGAFPSISDLDRSIPGCLSQFGYFGDSQKLSVQENSIAFSHCIRKLWKYGFISKQENFDLLASEWQACDSFIRSASGLGRVASFKNLPTSLRIRNLLWKKRHIEFCQSIRKTFSAKLWLQGQYLIPRDNPHFRCGLFLTRII